MKTNQEILDFFGVEIGKKYKITDQAVGVFTNEYIGTVFEVVEEKKALLLKSEGRDEEYGYTFAVFSLRHFDYEEFRKHLTDEEKKYLSAVIKPFRDSVITIEKLQFPDDKACICIEYRRYDGEEDRTYMPMFNINDLYLGMERNKKYTLEELGL